MKALKLVAMTVVMALSFAASADFNCSHNSEVGLFAQTNEAQQVQKTVNVNRVSNNTNGVVQ